ncbi:hypothetical protein J4447_03410 [Candidatus Pacearchaeota archaeon]|nr:hypothetical protein [Candidatus Pacearchaeota archaeon]
MSTINVSAPKEPAGRRAVLIDVKHSNLSCEPQGLRRLLVDLAHELGQKVYDRMKTGEFHLIF